VVKKYIDVAVRDMVSGMVGRVGDVIICDNRIIMIL